LNPERVSLPANPFRVDVFPGFRIPGFSLRSNPGLKIANAFGVIFNLRHYCPLFLITMGE
jgi:hypothetical protein